MRAVQTDRSAERQRAGWRTGFAQRTPILGALLRRWAVRRALARLRRGDPSAIPFLAEAAEAPAGAARPAFGTEQPAAEPAARRAREALAALEVPSLVDALCAEAARRPHSAAAAICREARKRPSDPDDACLFLFVTEQLDAYLEEDDDFQGLRRAYDRADDALRANVLAVVRSGDRRAIGFLGARKRLQECTEREIFLALQSFLTHREWPRLFQAFLELPLKYGWHVLRKLRSSGWEPEEPELRSLLRQALAEARNHWTPASSQRELRSGLLDRQLERGRHGPHSRLEPDDLLRRLSSADPLEGVSIVAALSTQVAPQSAAARRVAESPHWPVRLAGHLTGLTTDVVRDQVSDRVHWVSALAPARGVLELWPGRATPAHLEALAAAPAEAWEGRLGAARRILRALIARRVTVGRFEEILVEGDPFAGEFEPVSEWEWESGLEAPGTGGG